MISPESEDCLQVFKISSIDTLKSTYINKNTQQSIGYLLFSNGISSTFIPVQL
uniref:Uncharacterized protein n=1 Tax=Meloidogyne enterolobii TaxID=390850 RepID=A0A6V7TN44_MELEN|nr:unnamed protein product [Meloidogyne enterolobii]